jgi:cytoskeletal protein RodZ
MTFGDRAEVKRAKVGTKVLAFGCAIFAVLGSFWTIVWFIRSYVEPPRVTMSPALALAARDSTPAALPAKAAPAPKPEAAAPTPQPATAEAGPASPPPIQATPAEQAPTASSLSDRWLPLAPASEPAPAPAAEPETTASIPAPTQPEPPADEIAETSVPAISGPAPLPRRKPMQTASIRARTVEPPLPRPRPDGPAPQSVWTAVPSDDDRYQAGQ